MGRIEKMVTAANFTVLDESMVDMLQTIESKDECVSNEVLLNLHEDMGFLLKKSRIALMDAEYIELERNTIELANKALLVGAKKMLKSIYELQSLARCNNKLEASKTLDCLEYDWLIVRDEIETISK